MHILLQLMMITSGIQIGDSICERCENSKLFMRELSRYPMDQQPLLLFLNAWRYGSHALDGCSLVRSGRLGTIDFLVDPFEFARNRV